MAEDRKHRYGSFDYKVINKNIRNVLDNRSRLDNTVQIAMPFVKATTTIRHEFLGNGNIGFTLGLHGIDEDVKYDDIYSSVDGTAPLIGYTYTPDNKSKRVYAANPEFDEVSTKIGNLFDKQASLVTYPYDSNFIRIPPPGITSVTVGRNKNGLLASAQIEITIPTLIQLECLHRTFLVPGLGMILEWGQQFAVESLTTNVAGELPDISNIMFPWYDRSRLEPMLKKLARREVGLNDILEKYVYPTQGQYMWMFGRVANFNIQSNSDGSFKATVKIVGPSEDAWAYSTTTTVVPRKDPSADYFCASDVNSVQRYFMDTTSGLNLKSLLDGIRIGGKLPDWKDHVVYFKQGNQEKEGDPKPTTETPTVDEKNFGNSEEAYFMTWRFFVNVVINDPVYGIKAIFSRAGIDSEKLATIGLLLPYAEGENRQNTNIGKRPYIDDPKESFVGMNKYLRSIDPSVLIIVNELAVNLAKQNEQYNIPALKDEKLLTPTDDSNEFIRGKAEFDKSANAYLKKGSDPDKGFLSCGVWINHKAVVESMLSGDTILRGISNLLERMNSATRGFWQLTLDQIEGDEKLPNPHSYIVVDANWKESSDVAVSKFLDDVHIFNKYVRNKDGSLVGSELIDCTIDLSLPKRLFSQIATLGLISEKEAEAAGASPTGEEKQSSIKISDPNDTLAKMFGITSVAIKDKNGQIPDLTVLPVNEAQSATGTCGGANVQTVAGTGGQGYQAGGINLKEIPKNDKDFQTEYSRSLKELESDVCKQCNSQNCGAPTPQLVTPSSTANITNSSVSYKAKNGQTIVVPIVYDYPGSNKISNALYAAGYRNGRIPSEYLKAVNGNHRLYPEVADAFLSMQNKYKADTGKTFTINEAYRPLSTQISYIPQKGWYDKSPPADSNETTGKAGTPGKSNHGFGLALDIATNGGYGGSVYKWLSSNASAFGFTNIPKEPWHWEYSSGQLKLPPTPITAQPNQPVSSPTAKNKQEPGHAEKESSTSNVCKKLSDLTIQEIISTQKPSGKVLAVGKYQAIPVTFKDWVASDRISADTVFDIAAQERLGDWLIVGKRPKVGQYINNTGNVTIEEAHLQLAREFASIPVPYDLTNDRGTFIKAGESYYKDRGGNKANHSISEVRSALTQSKSSKSLTPIKKFIAKGEGGYDSLNTGIGGDTITYSEKYFQVLNSCEKTTSAAPTPQQSTQNRTNQEITVPQSQFCVENKAECDKCKLNQEKIRQYDIVKNVTNEAQNVVRQFPGLRKAFRYVEVFPDLMVASITSTANGNNSNAFGASPGSLSISGDLTLPGINGIRVGELFWIDRIPAFYKAFGAFQVMSVEDIIGLDGWKTRINARFYYLGTKWKQVMFDKLSGVIK